MNGTARLTLSVDSGGTPYGSLKTSVPSPYSVKLGAYVALNSMGTKPPLSSNRRTMSFAPVACSSPVGTLGLGVGAAVGVPVWPGGDDGAAAAEHAARVAT